MTDGIFKARNKHAFLWKEPLKEEFTTKLNEKLLVMLTRLCRALCLLLIKIPMSLPFAIAAIVWNGLFALFFYALGRREDARDFMNDTGKMFKRFWEGIKLEFSAKEILKDYYEMAQRLHDKRA